MTTTRIGGAALVLFALALLVPTAIQRIQRRLARKRLRAELLSDLRLSVSFAAAQIDELLELNRAQETTITAYRNANVRLVDFIRDQQEAGWTMPDLWDASVSTPTFFEAAAQQSLDWLDRETWGQS